MDTRDTVRSELYHGALRYGLTLDENALRSFEQYTALVADWNTRVNLVSGRDLERFLRYHLLDSLKTACCFDFRKTENVLDFGSGAGLPGIPLAIAFPHLAISLVDSRQKRCIFLEEAVQALGFHRVSVHWSRLEEFDVSRDGSFDAVTTRGTVALASFFTDAARFLRPGGTLIAIKGDTIEEELELLRSVADHSVFNIIPTVPPEVPGVRTGTLVLVVRK